MNSKTIFGIIVLIIVVVGGIAIAQQMNQPDDRNPIQRVGDAVEKLPDTGEAAEQLEDQSPVDKIGNEIEEATDGDGK